MSSEKRSKGTGGLEKRRGIWLARWTVDGKRFTRSTGTGNRREAEKVLDEITAPLRLKDKRSRLLAVKAQIGSVEDDIVAMREKTPGITIADAWEAYVRAPERPDTAAVQCLTAYKARWGMFAEYMRRCHPATVELRHVTRDHIVQWLPEVEAGRSPKTFNVIIRLCKNVWRTLAENPDNKLPEHSPFEKVKPKLETTQSRRALTSDELFRIAKHLEGKGELRLLFLIGIYTGLRLGDAATLKWSQVDMGIRKIEVTPRKTSRVGTVVRESIHASLYDELAKVPMNKRTGYILPEIGATYDNSRNGAGQVQRRTMDVFHACGIETSVEAKDGGHRRTLVGFHSLRHSFVTLQINAGVSPAVVQRMVGHTTLAMTGRYYHESDEAMREALMTIPDVTGKVPVVKPEVTRWERFKEAVADMGEDERRRAVAYLNSVKSPVVIDVAQVEFTPAVVDFEPLCVV